MKDSGFIKNLYNKAFEKDDNFITDRNSYHLFAKFNAIAGFVLIALMIYTVYSSTNDMNSKLDKIYKYSRDNVYSTILMTPNGVPLNVKKIPISPDSEPFKEGIKKFMKDIIVDGIEITEGYDKKVEKAKDIFDNTKRLQDFFNKYINRSDREKLKTGFSSFTSFLNFLFILSSNDNLPENIRILSSDVSNYIVDDNKYDIEISYRVFFESFIVEKNKTEQKIGFIKIKMSGEYDLEESTIENPYGNKINKMQIEYVHKRPLENDIYFDTKANWDILDFKGDK
jgi:hypothetical protein